MDNGIDLGSSTTEDEFDPWADEFTDDATEDAAATEQTPAQPPTKPEAQTPAPKQPNTVVASANTAKTVNPLETAIGDAETNDVEKAKQNIYEKPPVFDYAGATENIEDSSQTFDELRISKATDFLELEDGKRVSWTVEYGKITKTVSDAKGTSIGKIKSDIETSAEFTNALKKLKDKNPVCKVKPRVTAQSKGAGASYKGVFTNMADVDAAGKAISILPAKDGKVYEIRNNELGWFITPIVGCEMLSDVKAGFTRGLDIPLIPMDLIVKIISFFRYFTRHGADNEVLVNVYWDKENREFVIDTPAQLVSKTSIHSNENPDYVNGRYIQYMDIHSHNSMRAFFSSADNEDEKATRLYTVIGRLDKYLPEIRTRISNGGKFHEIDPGEVFEYISKSFPYDWKDKISFREPHKDVENTDAVSSVDKHFWDSYENDDFH